MNAPRLRLQLDDKPRAYHPGDALAGRFNLEGVAPEEIRALELSVLWHTEGKGDEDMSVHHFERVEPQNGQPIDLRQPRRFSTMLPNSPLSYDGLIVKICWRVRLRVFLTRGKELSAEVPFQLGELPHPQEVAT
ncbi:MAG: hypothetical protein AB7O59_17175 [Pirellulales bacterium]